VPLRLRETIGAAEAVDILVPALSESDEFCCRSFAEQECLEGVGEAGRTAL